MPRQHHGRQVARGIPHSSLAPNLPPTYNTSHSTPLPYTHTDSFPEISRLRHGMEARHAYMHAQLDAAIERTNARMQAAIESARQESLALRQEIMSIIHASEERTDALPYSELRGLADTPAVLPPPGDGPPSAGASTRSDESVFSSDGDRVLRAVDLASRGAGPPAASPDQVAEPGRAAAPSLVRSQVDAALTASFHRAVDLQKQITDILFDTNCKVTNHHWSLILGHLHVLIQECADLRAVAARHCGRADELCDQLERTRTTGAGVSLGVAPTTSPPASPGALVPPGGAADSVIRRDHAHIMFLTPLVPTATAADDLSPAMKNKVDLVKERIGDISVRKIPRGLTILSDDKGSMDRLKAAIESNVVTNTTMSIRFAQKRKPHVKLTRVDPDVPAVNLIAELNARNPNLTVDPSTCSVRTSFKERSGNFTHVVEVDPPAFRSLMARGRVAVGWTSAAVVEDFHVPTCTFSLALCGSRRTGPCARAARLMTSLLNVRSVWVAQLCAAMNAAMRAITARTPLAINHALSWSAELLVCEREPTMDDAPYFSTGVTRGGLGAFGARGAVRGCAGRHALSPRPSAHSGPLRLSLNFREPRFLILDWLNRSVWFDRVVGCRFSSSMALELVFAQFYRIYDDLHTRNLRAVKPHATSGNAWWTPQLAAERSRVRAMRRRLQRTRDHDLRAVFRAQYARTFSCYKRNIRHAKDTFDRSLCQELTTRNLFADPFKLAFAKLSPPTHLPPLFQTDGNLTSSVLSSAALLLRVHVGADDPARTPNFIVECDVSLTQSELIRVDTMLREETKLAHGLPHYTATKRLLALGTHNTLGSFRRFKLRTEKARWLEEIEARCRSNSFCFSSRPQTSEATKEAQLSCAAFLRCHPCNFPGATPAFR
ncbi:hypothetical protein HPB49_007947 [Dermacentor silvarum]|uniref:Uncharacterized protein n=1 Tax=Dermacentor silvarum TaxID=543639 RepID=A0ACB8C2P7_DERSI|nr:hypothetical protein HPB49_007947 [Dermacentor silvarum]